MTINLYLASFDTCHEWPGRWFEISSLEDLKEAILSCRIYGVEEIEVCDFEEDFRFEDITLFHRNSCYGLFFPIKSRIKIYFENISFFVTADSCRIFKVLI